LHLQKGQSHHFKNKTEPRPLFILATQTLNPDALQNEKENYEPEKGKFTALMSPLIASFTTSSNIKKCLNQFFKRSKIKKFKYHNTSLIIIYNQRLPE